MNQNFTPMGTVYGKENNKSTFAEQMI